MVSKSTASRARIAAILAAGALAWLSPAPARAQLFDWGSPPPAYQIEASIAASGYRLTRPILRCGDVYLASVLGARDDLEQLVVDARDGRLLERSAARLVARPEVILAPADREPPRLRRRSLQLASREPAASFEGPRPRFDRREAVAPPAARWAAPLRHRPASTSAAPARPLAAHAGPRPEAASAPAVEAPSVRAAPAPAPAPGPPPKAAANPPRAAQPKNANDVPVAPLE
jgi:hypothetical protein